MAMFKVTGAESEEQLAVNTRFVVQVLDPSGELRKMNVSISEKANCVIVVMNNVLEVRETFDLVLKKIERAEKGWGPNDKEAQI
jgi:hypothetical protein